MLNQNCKINKYDKYITVAAVDLIFCDWFIHLVEDGMN